MLRNGCGKPQKLDFGTRFQVDRLSCQSLAIWLPRFWVYVNLGDLGGWMWGDPFKKYDELSQGSGRKRGPGRGLASPTTRFGSTGNTSCGIPAGDSTWKPSSVRQRILIRP